MTCLFTSIGPAGPVCRAGDDTVTEHPGLQGGGKGRHHDVGRATHRDTAYRWGHTWGIVSVLVKVSCATRPWALPVVVTWYRAPAWDRRMKHDTRRPHSWLGSTSPAAPAGFQPGSASL
jgi:hypothetical protein